MGLLVWVEREVEELFPSVCLSVWTIFNLPDKMDVSKGIPPNINEAIILCSLGFSLAL